MGKKPSKLKRLKPYHPPNPEAATTTLEKNLHRLEATIKGVESTTDTLHQEIKNTEAITQKRRESRKGTSRITDRDMQEEIKKSGS
jgi:hypothetical protein